MASLRMIVGKWQFRNQLSKRNSLVKDVGEAFSLHDGMFRAGISTATETFSAHGKFAGGIVAPYTVYKGKAALSAAPVLPTFSKLDSGGLKVHRRGTIMLTFWPASGERKYDWEKRQRFALSATEVGSLISLASKDSCEFFHDPSMLSSNAGQVRKTLSVKPNDSGYFISLSVVNNIQKTNDRFSVPVTSAEFAVMRTAFSVWQTVLLPYLSESWNTAWVFYLLCLYTLGIYLHVVNVGYLLLLDLDEQYKSDYLVAFSKEEKLALQGLK